ncbi:MAG: hypothetical protein RLZZ293_853 [Pseudomonadota bacterium]|jgi:glycosyltransferase involved in cell wall biosynthesis
MQKVKISLICATYQRTDELANFLASLVAQTYTNFEIIIVDQNPSGVLDFIISSYTSLLNLRWIRSAQLGSSVNRNLGLSLAQGEIIGFPDDDCYYYPDTLVNVIELFLNHPSVDLLYGRIYDRINHQQIMRNWPQCQLKLTNLYQLLLYSSAIVIFYRPNSMIPAIKFDERFGINQSFGALEDVDFCYQNFKLNAQLIYTPQLVVNHPPVSSILLNHHKAYNYGLGWGGFFAKHWSWRIFPLFIGLWGYLLCLLVRDLILFKPTAKGRIYSLAGRVVGFVRYLKLMN